MKVLVACERSGVVRDAFRRAGHLAMSCDLVDTDSPGPHYVGDVRDLLDHPFDLLVAHPPCTYLCNISTQHLHRPEATTRWRKMDEAVKFFQSLRDCAIPHKCLENPVMHGYALELVGPHTQIIHPWQFGDEASKPTCLWLVNLPTLVPTHIVPKGEFVVYNGRRMAKWFNDAWNLPPEERAKVRSETFYGIADAMSKQWSDLPPIPCPS